VLATDRASAIEGFLPQPKTGTLGGGMTTFSTITKTAITCTKMDNSTITFEKDHHATGTLEFLGCKSLGVALNSLGSKKEEVFVKALVLVCLAAGKSLFGITIETDEDLHLEIPALGVLLDVNGRAIGQILTAGKAEAFTVDFTGKEGKQEPSKCKDEEGVGKEQTLTLEQNHSTKPEAASLNIEAGSLKFTGIVELMNA